MPWDVLETEHLVTISQCHEVPYPLNLPKLPRTELNILGAETMRSVKAKHSHKPLNQPRLTS